MLEKHLIDLISELRGDTFCEGRDKWSQLGNLDNCPTN
jgi:hypothetical protein